MPERRTTATRLHELEEYAVRHGETITEALRRINLIEEKMRAQEIKDVREEGAWEKVLTQLKGFDKRLSAIEGYGNKALGVLIVAIIGAFAAFIIRGGLI